MTNRGRVGLTSADKANIARKIEERETKRAGKPSILESDETGSLDKSRTPFNALRLKRNILGLTGKEKVLPLYELAMEMTKAGYPAKERDLQTATEGYIGETRRFAYTGFLGMEGVLTVTKLEKGRYKVSSTRPSKK